MELSLPSPPTPENAPRFAALAVEAALSLDGVCLDYSPGSIRKLEELLDRHAGDGRVKASVLVFGCYLGEVFVRAGRGRWRSTAETPMRGFAGFPLIVELGSQDYCDPLGRVRGYSESGAGESLVRFWEAFNPPVAPRRWWRRLLGR